MVEVIFPIANIATQETKQFYNTYMELLLDKQELRQVNELLLRWNRKIFPAALSPRAPTPDDTPLAPMPLSKQSLSASLPGPRTSSDGSENIILHDVAKFIQRQTGWQMGRKMGWQMCHNTHPKIKRKLRHSRGPFW